MKRSIYIYLVVCLTIAFALYQYCNPNDLFPKSSHSDKSHLEICRRSNNIRGASLQPFSTNYRGPNLVSNSTDSTDLVLCPGDTFGDPNGTYVTLHNCYFEMYHQDKRIWASKESPRPREGGLCALSLQKDGNLVLYEEIWMCYVSFGEFIIDPSWDSMTDFSPLKTELRIQEQQLQIVQTLKNGSERLFYAGENSRQFREDLGTPKQVAEKFLIKNHDDTDDTILRRNEYIGDLNSLHLIFQTNCELQLINKNKIIWSFAAYFKHELNCTLKIQDGNSIGIPSPPNARYFDEGMNILPYNNLTVLQSLIIFQEDQLVIIQTLQDGSEIIFYSEPGQDNGLKLKRELRQIAKNNITVSSEIIFGRLDYMGDLDGLHLILQNNCAFVLANGKEEIWKLQESLDGPFMECFIKFKGDGTITFDRLTNNGQYSRKKNGDVQVFGKKSYEKGDPVTSFQFSLENNMMIMTLDYQNNMSNIYHGGANTNGTWFRYISESSLTINANETTDQVFVEMGYIGDINGVYVIQDKKGNWILFNKTQAIWESGTTQSYESGFALILKRDGNVALNYNWWEPTKNYFWSTDNATKASGELNTTELVVNNEGMWLIHNYVDGTQKKYIALKGTNSFALGSNEQVEAPIPSSIYKR